MTAEVTYFKRPPSKLLLLLLFCSLAIGAIGADYNDPVEAMKRFRSRQNGLEITLSAWRDTFAQNCPYFSKPPSAPPNQSKSVITKPVCANGQRMDYTLGKCVCSHSDHEMNHLGNCEPKTTSIGDPCGLGKPCEVCRSANGKELCKTCGSGSDNCKLCLYQNGLIVKCIECGGRTCCTKKLVSSDSTVCGQFPRGYEGEPSVGPRPPTHPHPPTIMYNDEPSKVCYELDFRVRQLLEGQSLIPISEPEAKAYVCKTCTAQAPCKLWVCQGNRCDECSHQECIRPFENHPLQDPCLDGKRCQFCRYVADGSHVCKTCQHERGVLVCRLCINDKCSVCPDGRCQICLKSQGCQDFPVVSSKPPVRDVCLNGNCRVCVQRVLYGSNNSVKVEETCKECTNGECQLCVNGTNCKKCERNSNGYSTCPTKDPVFVGEPKPEPCDGQHCTVCSKFGKSTLCKTCVSGSCRICRDGDCRQCAADGSCLNCNRRGYCRPYPPQLPPRLPSECGKDRPCLMCRTNRRNTYSCIKCDNDGRCCQTNTKTGECKSCGGLLQNQCSLATPRPVCENTLGSGRCKDCYTNLDGRMLCRKCRGGECFVFDVSRFKRKTCDSYCMKYFPEVPIDQLDDYPITSRPRIPSIFKVPYGATKLPRQDLPVMPRNPPKTPNASTYRTRPNYSGTVITPSRPENQIRPPYASGVYPRTVKIFENVCASGDCRYCGLFSRSLHSTNVLTLVVKVFGNAKVEDYVCARCESGACRICLTDMNGASQCIICDTANNLCLLDGILFPFRPQQANVYNLGYYSTPNRPGYQNYPSGSTRQIYIGESDRPAYSYLPNIPDLPNRPNGSSAPGQPGYPTRPGQSSYPNRPDQSGYLPGQPTYPTRPQQSVNPTRPDQPTNPSPPRRPYTGCIPARDNGYCIGTIDCIPTDQNLMCATICSPLIRNAWCRGTPQCLPRAENDFCDRGQPRQCISSPDNTYCVGTPQCQTRAENNFCKPRCTPTPANKYCQGTDYCQPHEQNNYCKPVCIPKWSNNYCRGFENCVPQSSNRLCDKKEVKPCEPSSKNSYCIGTPDCVSREENAYCKSIPEQCRPEVANNWCRGRPECEPRRSNRMCDNQASTVCEPSIYNNYCVGTPTCQPQQSNSLCKSSGQCTPKDANNWCRGTAQCQPTSSNNYCDKTAPKVCVPGSENNNCVGTPYCVPIPANNYCRVDTSKTCEPNTTNNYCRGTKLCLPNLSNDYCDRQDDAPCDPAPENKYCLGTRKCVPSQSNAYCQLDVDCLPTETNNWCRGTSKCVPMPNNDYCDNKECVPNPENNYCVGTARCVPTDSNLRCGKNALKCVPAQANNWCRGTLECVPKDLNNYCDKDSRVEDRCVPDSSNNNCVGTPQCKPTEFNSWCGREECEPDPIKNNNCEGTVNCKPTLQNNFCLPLCVPSLENNWCRGTTQCRPVPSNDYCDELLIHECFPSAGNVFCSGTPECVPREENDFCSWKCTPSEANNYCRGSPECVPKMSNDFCDKDSSKTSSTPKESSVTSSACLEGRRIGIQLSSIYKSAIIKRGTTISEVRKSIECLIESVEITRMPIKLYCAYTAARESINELVVELKAAGIQQKETETLTPEDTFKLTNKRGSLGAGDESLKQSAKVFSPVEGTVVNGPSNLPVFSEPSNLQSQVYDKENYFRGKNHEDFDLYEDSAEDSLAVSADSMHLQSTTGEEHNEDGDEHV